MRFFIYFYFLFYTQQGTECIKTTTCNSNFSSFSSLSSSTDRDRVNIPLNIYVYRRRVVNVSWQCKSLQFLFSPHGSCHTLKGQKNRLNMVRLAFLLAKLRGVWTRCTWTPQFFNGAVVQMHVFMQLRRYILV